MSSFSSLTIFFFKSNIFKQEVIAVSYDLVILEGWEKNQFEVRREKLKIESKNLKRNYFKVKILSKESKKIKIPFLLNSKLSVF